MDRPKLLTRDLFSGRPPNNPLVLKAVRLARRELNTMAIEAEGGRYYGALLVIAARLLEVEGMYEQLMNDSAASAA